MEVDVDLDRLAEQMAQAALEAIPAVVRRQRLVDDPATEPQLEAKIGQAIAAALREYLGQEAT